MPPPARYLDCTPVRPPALPFNPAWWSETAVALARGIVAENAFDRLPILADALEEAGCDDPLLLRHCRECPAHRPHCWVVSEVLDRPPVVEPPRMTEAEVRREVERVTGQAVLRPSDRPWDGPSPVRLRLFRAMPLAVAALIALWVVWANLNPPLTGTQFTVPAPTAPKAWATTR